MSAAVAKFPGQIWDRSSDTRAADSSINRAPDYEDYDQIVAEIQALQGSLGTGYSGTPNGTGVALAARASVMQTVTLTLTNVNVAIADHTTSGASGSLKVLDLPEGCVLVLGAVTNLTIARVGTNIAAGASVVGSIGSAAAGADATLSSTEANIVPSTAATLSGGAGAFRGASTGVAFLDGTGTPADVYLNFAMNDAGDSGDADDALTVNGTITLNFINLGDHA
jgi:hypothetical protein